MKILIKNIEEIHSIDTTSYNCKKQSSIVIEDNLIKKINIASDEILEESFDKVIDASGKMALPGLINTHTHSAMTLLRGYADDLSLQDWLENKIWPFEASLTADDIYWGSKLAIMEMIKTGTTTFVDMYFQMDKVAEAVKESGIRGVLSEGLIEANDGVDGLKSSLEFCLKWNGQANGRIRTILGPHAPYTCSKDYLLKVIRMSEENDLMINIHLAETKKEYEDSIKKYGLTPVEYLNEIGLFKQDVLAAHCVYLSNEDIEILAKNNVGVSHNPSSNMKLASGIAKVTDMLKRNVNLSLGTDGVASNNNLNLIEEAKIASFLQKVDSLDPTVMDIETLLKILTINAAEALLLNKVGKIEVNYKADIILVDLEKSSKSYPHHNNLSNLFYSSIGENIDTVIIDGNIVYNQAEFLTMDREEIFYNIERIIKKKSL